MFLRHDSNNQRCACSRSQNNKNQYKLPSCVVWELIWYYDKPELILVFNKCFLRHDSNNQECACSLGRNNKNDYKLPSCGSLFGISISSELKRQERHQYLDYEYETKYLSDLNQYCPSNASAELFREERHDDEMNDYSSQHQKIYGFSCKPILVFRDAVYDTFQKR